MDPVSIIVAVAAIAFIIWLCILVPAKMASNRGRSAVLWVIVALLVSPLVSIIALYAMGDAEEKTLRSV